MNNTESLYASITQAMKSKYRYVNKDIAHDIFLKYFDKPDLPTADEILEQARRLSMDNIRHHLDVNYVDFLDNSLPAPESEEPTEEKEGFGVMEALEKQGVFVEIAMIAQRNGYDFIT